MLAALQALAIPLAGVVIVWFMRHEHDDPEPRDERAPVPPPAPHPRAPRPGAARRGPHGGAPAASPMRTRTARVRAPSLKR